MTINKALLALALAFTLAAVSNQPTAQAQNPSMDAANAALFAAATNTDTSTPAKPKPAQPQVIVVPAGTRVVYQRPKRQKYAYTSIKIGNATRIRFIDHELGVVCYFDNNHASHYGGQTDSCVHIPSLATYK